MTQQTTKCLCREYRPFWLPASTHQHIGAPPCPRLHSLKTTIDHWCRRSFLTPCIAACKNLVYLKPQNPDNICARSWQMPLTNCLRSALLFSNGYSACRVWVVRPHGSPV